jgi:hypothetical protein
LGVTGQSATSKTSVSFGNGVFTGLELIGNTSGSTLSSVVRLVPQNGMPTGLKIDGAIGPPNLTTGIDATAGVPVWTHGGFAGVIGDAPNGTGVIAQSQDGTGLVALTVNGAAMRLQRDGSFGSPTGRVQHSRGDLDTDNTNLWWCFANSPYGATNPDPTHWRKLAGPDTAGALHILQPQRIYDSRPGFSPDTPPKTKLAAGSDRTIDADGSSPLPTGTTAVLLNVAATNTTGVGFLGVFMAGTAWPGNASVNWDHSQATVSNFAVVPVDANKKFTIHAGGSGTVDVVVDLLGYCR